MRTHDSEVSHGNICEEFAVFVFVLPHNDIATPRKPFVKPFALKVANDLINRKWHSVARLDRVEDYVRLRELIPHAFKRFGVLPKDRSDDYVSFLGTRDLT